MVKSLPFYILIIVILASCSEDKLVEESIRKRVESTGSQLISYTITDKIGSGATTVYFFVATVKGRGGEEFQIEESLLFDKLNDGSWKLYSMR